MNTRNIINDLCTSNKIPAKGADCLIQNLNVYICSAIIDAKAANEPTVTLDIGIGSLVINIIDMQCKFIVSKDLKNMLKQSLDTGKDPLVEHLEKSLADKLVTLLCEK